MADPTRRTLLTLAGGLLLMGTDKDKLAWDFTFPAIEGGTLALADFKGRVVLVTNTASFCGYTYQYEALQKLHEAKSAAGLTVVGVPSQDFNQESADNGTVKTFCDTQFGIDFPLAAISHVRGAQAAPFYAWVAAQRNWQPQWNFNKVLIGRDGRIAGTFGSNDEPGGPALTRAIAAEVARI
jgi:glutathione peroxidase